MTRLSLILLAALSACTMADDPDTGAGGVVPLVVHYTSSGGLRLAAWVQIGDAPPFLALVDTGSSGLRVLPGAVDDSAYERITDELVSTSYHSGLALQGVVATGRVTLGGLTTAQAIPIMRVRQVGCTATVPACADASAFGYQAVLGIGMRTLDTAGGIGNPIAQLPGAPGFVVRAPAYGDDVGELDITAAAPAGPWSTVPLPALVDGAPLPNGVPAWDDRTVPTCVADLTHGAPYCAGALLDTGATPTELEWPAYTGAPVTWGAGTRVAVTLGPAAAPLAAWSFTVGAVPRPGVDEVVAETRADATADLINVGTAVFLRDDVWFDQGSGVIGLAPHLR